MNKTILTITGPSASGKSVLENMLVATGDFYKTVSATTRAPRPGEVEGRDYYFISREEFVTAQKAGEFIESVYFGGNGYAINQTEIHRAFDADKHVVVVCEPIGAKQISKYCQANDIKHLSIFVTNDEETLLKRFMEREFKDLHRLTAEQIKYKARRLNSLIEDEMKWVEAADWHIVVERFDATNEDAVVDFIHHQFMMMKTETTETTLLINAN